MSLKIKQTLSQKLNILDVRPWSDPFPCHQKYIGFTVNNPPLKFDAPCSKVVIYVTIILHFKPTSSLRLHPA